MATCALEAVLRPRVFGKFAASDAPEMTCELFVFALKDRDSPLRSFTLIAGPVQRKSKRPTPCQVIGVDGRIAQFGHLNLSGKGSAHSRVSCEEVRICDRTRICRPAIIYFRGILMLPLYVPAVSVARTAAPETLEQKRQSDEEASYTAGGSSVTPPSIRTDCRGMVAHAAERDIGFPGARKCNFPQRIAQILSQLPVPCLLPRI